MRKTILAGLAFAALAATSASGVAQADEGSLEQINASTSSAVVYLETTWSGYVYDTNKDSHGHAFGWVRQKPFTLTNRCTGFVVNPDGYIVTAGHCLEYTNSIEQQLAYQAIAWENSRGVYGKGYSTKELYKWFGQRYRAYGEDGHKPDRTVMTALGISMSGESTVSTKPARVLSLKGFDKGDVALVKIEAENLPSVTLAPEDTVEVGTEVVSVGFPASVDMVTDPTMDPSYKDGTISSIKPIQDGLLNVYEISSQMSGGMSGGPTLNSSGQVVGLNSFGIVGESKGFSFIRPASIISEMLTDEGVSNEVGDVQQTYLDGLAAYFDGDRATAVDDLDRVLAQVPSYSLAQEYRAKAETLAEPAPTQSGLPILPLGLAILGALVVLGVVAAAIVLLVRRQGRPDGSEGIELTSNPSSDAPTQQTPTVAAQPRNGTRSCDGCGANLAHGARFCSNCGTPAGQQVLA
jgi:V8-like Glu-specific endopeptidase